MKKRLLAIIALAIVATMTLTGCGSDTVGTPTTTPSATPQATKTATPSQTPTPTPTPVETETPKETPEETPKASGIIEGDFDTFSIKYLKHEIVKDYKGKDTLAVHYTFTNNQDEAKEFLFSQMSTAYQDGVELETAIVTDEVENGDNVMKKVKKGTPLDVVTFYVLSNTQSDVELEMSELSFTKSNKLTQVIKL